jgi:hypothetical protein
MGFRLYRRKSLGHGLWAGASKSGLALAVLDKWEPQRKQEIQKWWQQEKRWKWEQLHREQDRAS